MFLNDEKVWNKIRNNAEYQPLRDMIEKEFDENCRGKDIPQISFQLEIRIFKDGNRCEFEKLYFLRRKQLSAYALMAMLYPENDEYIKGLENVICEICNEYSWQLPAHRQTERFNRRNGIALFSAETGLYLAEIKAIFGDRLHPLVVERITTELKWRIIESFKKRTEGFESFKSNWAAVCGGAVGTVFMYEDPEGYIEVKQRLDKCMQNYLESCCDEGSTSEGISYWDYGFSFFVLYHDMLRRYTFGRVDGFKSDMLYIKHEKLKNLANFFNSLCLDEKNVVSFSDGSQKLSYTSWLLEFLNREYQTELPPVEGGVLGIDKFSSAVRSCIYYTPERKTKKFSPMKKHYKELQWYIERKENYSFAAKGGHNAEEHNHNDIGSFIITHKEQCIFADLGAPEYNADTFGIDAYDHNLNKSSLGHSVPVINGTIQKFGREYCGNLNVEKNIVSIEFANAYPEKIKSLNRKFELLEDKIILCDKFDGAKNVTERFVTEIEPVEKDGVIMIADVKITTDKKHKFVCEYEDIKAHDGINTRRVYKLDFEVFGDEFETKIEF